ncbi:uncharacterized protein LOC131941997 [Physella acuta]|uniref:uncharacterized protein LOC131941997 n=1 Tax=Physella acuta TaxID=109671 RepID=UPI0027DE606D|nr:uncharacterized protein LOC131941997 [Physella acuta]
MIFISTIIHEDLDNNSYTTVTTTKSQNLPSPIDAKLHTDLKPMVIVLSTLFSVIILSIICFIIFIKAHKIRKLCLYSRKSAKTRDSNLIHENVYMNLLNTQSDTFTNQDLDPITITTSDSTGQKEVKYLENGRFISAEGLTYITVDFNKTSARPKTKRSRRREAVTYAELTINTPHKPQVSVEDVYVNLKPEDLYVNLQAEPRQQTKNKKRKWKFFRVN